ncbi:MAG: FtsQ-type POTRA domain-containing protein [Anaerolineales bacterium]|nr:FtsQ-type POTRA domain-containing protein [Anaerolineales bacterium]
MTTLFTSPRWISCIILLLVGGSFFLVGYDHSFVISGVQVAGATTLSEEAVIEASGMENVHILWVDPFTTASNVAAMPNVLTATVEIAWPNQALITVSEREPVLVWDQAGDRFWVDATGQLMQARQYKSELLLILSQEPEDLNPGDRIGRTILEGALQLQNLRPNINVLYYKSDTGLSYLDGRNWEAFFGVGTDMNQKLVVYESLVYELMARDLQPKYISVINKEKPFYRLASSEQ